MPDPAPPATRRVALVIGIGAYQTARKLVAPPGDAARMAQLLQGLNFRVLTSFNSEYNDLRQALREFYDALRGADIGLLYFSGHGVQDNARENYLLPADADLHEAEDLTRLAFSLRRIMSDIHDRVETGLIFLDACRDNPFDGLAEPATKSAATGGLAKVKGSLGGLLVAFASDEGNVALDGAGDAPSPFTSALLRHLPVPGRPVTSALIDVSREVEEATKGRQTPWTQASLKREVVLVPVAGSGPVDEPKPEPQPPNPPPPSGGFGKVAIALLLAIAIGIGGFLWLHTAPTQPDPSLTDSAPQANCSGLDYARQMACRVPDLNSPDKDTRIRTAIDVENILNNLSLPASDKSPIVARLLDLTAPQRFTAMSDDGRYNVLSRLALIPTALWTDPAMLVPLERAHSAITTLRLDPDIVLGDMSQTRLQQWITTTGYRPRNSITVYPQFAGLTREAMADLMRGLSQGWGWITQPADLQSSATGLAQIRYGTDAMRPLALLMAAQLNGQVPPHSGNGADDQTIAKSITAAGLRPVTVAKIRMKDNQLELWLGE